MLLPSLMPILRHWYEPIQHSAIHSRHYENVLTPAAGHHSPALLIVWS